MEAGGYGEHDEEDDGTARACGNGDDPGAGDREEGNAGGVSHEYQGYGEAGAGGEAEDVGAGEGVAKERLHLETGEGEGAAGEGAGEGFGHAEVPDNVFPDRVGRFAAGYNR